MPQNSRRRNTITIVLVLLLLVALLLLVRCKPTETPVPGTATNAPPTAPASTPAPSGPAATQPATREPDEILTPALIHAPADVSAGAVFSITWTGPGNSRDYVTLVRKDAPDDASAEFHNTRDGATLEFTAPITTGDWELRYVAWRSRKILGRAPLVVTPIKATLEAAREVIMGADFPVSWTGPNNARDYITIVSAETPDGQYGNYTATATGSPLTLRAPTIAGAAELRYMTGQGNKVIGRRPIVIVFPEVSLSAPATAIVGSKLEVAWVGPNNASDYITLVARERPDGEYGNYTATSNGSPLSLLVPIMTGDAELRYMTGQGNKVIGRRAIALLPVEATLSAPAEARAGTAIAIAWTGPNYASDYITVVPDGTPDGEYRTYAYTNTGSPLNVKAPDAAGECEIRYMAAQGAKVIARRPIRITP